MLYYSEVFGVTSVLEC